ncbi:MAG TPA: hypothetical protein DCF33_07035 [Saprospirales bacterium]|nr:hypothetical protein [Saprospirales bacterium]
MAFVHRQILISLIVLGIALVIWLVYLILPAKNSLFSAIPAQTALVLECKDLLTVRKIADQIPGSAWTSMVKSTWLQQYFEDTDLAFRLFRHEPAFLRLIAQSPAIAAFSLHPADSLHALFILELTEAPDLNKLLKNNDLNKKWSAHTFHNQTIIQVPVSPGKNLEITSSGHFLLFSQKADLVEAALAELDAPRNWWSQRPLTGDLAQASLRVHFRPGIWAQHSRVHMQAGYRELPDLLARNVEWAGWAWDGSQVDCLLETKGFLANVSSWGQKAEGYPEQLLPNHTTLVLRSGVSKPNPFFESIGNGMHPDFAQYVLPWVGSDALLAITEPLPEGLATDRLVLLPVRDSARAVQALRAYGREYGIRPEDSGVYQMFELMVFQQGSLLAPLLGEDAAFRNPVVALVGGYAVFAPHRAAMEVLLDKYLVGQTLSTREDFLLWKQKQSHPGMLECLFNTAGLDPILAQISSFSFGRSQPEPGWLGASLIAEGPEKLRVQWTYQPIFPSKRQAELLWKTPLKSLVNGRVWVTDLSPQQTAIMVQDERQILYGLDAMSGQLLWSRVLPEAILSDIQSVDYFKSGNQCLIFNTNEALYLLDHTGRDVQGFPFKWPEKTTNSVTVVDFDRDRRYSFFVPCSNNICYGFDPFGRPLTGWNRLEMEGKMGRPVVHFQHAGKDFLALLTDDGKLSVYGRDGRLRFGPVVLHGVFKDPLYVDAGAQEPHLYAANTAGELFVCNLEGGVTRYDTNRPGSTLLFGQFRGDPGYEWVQWDGGNLRLGGFSGEKMVVYSSKSMKDRPNHWFITPYQTIGAVDTISKRIWMFDRNGHLLPGFPLGGQTPFEHFREKDLQLLITSVNQEIWAYRIPPL